MRSGSSISATARFDADHCRLDLGEQFHRSGADRGPIEAQVLSRLRRFRHHQARADQRGRTAQRGVGPFERFDRGDHAVADGDRLPDVVAAEAARDRECEIEIARLRGSRLGTCAEAGAREPMLDHRHRIDHFDSFGFDFMRDAAEHRVVAEARDSREHLQRARVGREGIFQPRARDAAGHRRFRHAGVFEHVDYLLQLADFDPGDLAGHRVERPIAFIQMCDGDDFSSARARRACHFEREDAVARDEPELIHARGQRLRASS